MQLKIVVLPAPLGPIRPTISNSPTRTLTSRSACSPPKRMDTPSVSRTGIDPLRARSRTGVVHAEALALQPAPDRRGQRAHPVGLEDEGHDRQRAGDGLHEVPGVRLQ